MLATLYIVSVSNGHPWPFETIVMGASPHQGEIITFSCGARTSEIHPGAIEDARFRVENIGHSVRLSLTIEGTTRNVHDLDIQVFPENDEARAVAQGVEKYYNPE